MLEVFTFIISIILLILLVTDWTATIVLHRATQKANTNNIALRERFMMAAILAIASTCNAALAIFRITDIRFFDTPLAFLPILILTVSLILGSIPNLYWLSLYLRNKLNK